MEPIKDLVSAIITTHNRCELLQRAIESVFAQTYNNIECIVVDDASSDDTSKICEQYNLKYIYIPKEESKGGNYARNLGIKASKGKYCAFLDDDDYWLPKKIEKQVALINEKDCELVYCGRKLEIIASDDSISYQDLLPSAEHWGDMHKKILWAICTTTTNILAKRSALLDVGLFDEELKFWQEYELTIRLAQRKPFYFVNEVLSVYRVDNNDNNRLTNKYTPWKSSVKYIHRKHKPLYKNLNIIEKMKMWSLFFYDASGRLKNVGRNYSALIANKIGFVLHIPYAIMIRMQGKK